MWKAFKSSNKGAKLARECSALTKQIVNHLILKKYDVKTHDTLFFFQESFTFLSVVARDEYGGAKQHGNMIAVALDTLSDWLNEILFQGGEGDYGDEIDKILLDLPDAYFTNWVKELIADNPDLKGGTNTQLIVAANSKYILAIDSYIHEKFGKSPDKLLEYLSAITEQSVNILV